MDIGKIRSLLGIKGTENDMAIQFAIDDVTEIILNYCNIKSIPPGLENTACRMAMDLYRSEGVGNDTAPVQVSSISIGGTSTSFKSASDNIKGTLLKNYKASLRRFRKLGW